MHLVSRIDRWIYYEKIHWCYVIFLSKNLAYYKSYAIIILQIPCLKNYTHCFYKVSTVNKCERTFINVTYVDEKEREEDDEKKHLNLSSCTSKIGWDGFVCKIKDAQASIIFCHILYAITSLLAIRIQGEAKLFHLSHKRDYYISRWKDK